MDLQNNSLDDRADLAQFLEKFKEPAFPSSESSEEASSSTSKTAPAQTDRYEKTFEKLEQKIEELEARFDAATGQNQLVLAELARQREAISDQKDRDAFMDHLSHTIANLKASVENLTRMQQVSVPSFPTAAVQRSFDTAPRQPADAPTDMYRYEPETYRAFREQRQRAAQEERERIIASLHQKASQLKAVNSALDREIKKVQQEKMAALKKSAEQAKEILSLREQLTAAEEKFKSFNFEGRIISIRQEYEQKVSSLETQLQEISATCMKQVEEIESLRAQNVKLQNAAKEKEEVSAKLEEKEREVAAVKAQMAGMEQNHSAVSKQQLEVFAKRLRDLESQRDELSGKLQAAEQALEAVRGEKEMLEKNFQELMAKIEQNDAVIAQLKQKIEVLGQQNQTLTQQNQSLAEQYQSLTQQNQDLSQQNQSLTEQNAQLTDEKNRWEGEKVSYEMRVRSAEQDREVLMSRSEALSHAKHTVEGQVQELVQAKQMAEARAEELAHAKQTVEAQVEELTQANAVLMQEKKTAQAKAKQLAGEKEAFEKQAQDFKQKNSFLMDERAALNEENKQLRNQSAALLAARLVQVKIQQEKENAVNPADPTPAEQAPVTNESAPQETADNKQEVRVSAADSVSEQPVTPAEKQPEKLQEEAPLFDGPVTITGRAKSSVTSSADLPEIKVAKMVPPPQNSFDGEDFLEKTDSFLGRMKWSLFREDK